MEPPKTAAAQNSFEGVSEAEMNKIIKSYLIDTLKMKFTRKYKKDEEISIENEVVIVTGANKGIGKAICIEMALRKAKVIMACRDLTLGQTALNDIKKITSNENIHLEKLDVADFDSIRSFADLVNTKYPKVKILINNAGVLNVKTPGDKTSDGLNKTMVINYFGPVLLTNLLLKNITDASNETRSRVINITSLILQAGQLNIDDLGMKNVSNFGFQNYLAYANSKLALSYFSKELSKKVEKCGVNVYSLCPGLVRTDLSDIEENKIIRFIARQIQRSPTQSTDTILYCSIGKKTENETGMVYQNLTVSPLLSESLKDDELSEKIWTKTREIIGLTD